MKEGSSIPNCLLFFLRDKEAGALLVLVSIHLLLLAVFVLSDLLPALLYNTAH
jgi:hypothetical protein